MNHTWMALLRSAVILLAACAGEDQRMTAGECRRPTARTFADNSTLTLAEIGDFGCKILYVPTGVELRADAAGNVPDIGMSIARDSRGRYYSSTTFGEITVWSPDGKVLRSIGREGKGPGELGRGRVTLTIDPADNLYIRDNNRNWSVFGPDYTFLRSFRSSGIGFRPEAGTFIAPFTLVTTEFMLGDATGTPQQHYFRVFDFSGKTAASLDQESPPVLRSQGDFPASEQTPIHSPYAKARLMTPPVNGEFWIGPPNELGRGYELQLWTIDGKLKRTIKREVGWFKPGSDIPARPAFNPREDDNSAAGPDPKPPTAIGVLQHDGSGLLYVLVGVTNNKWDGSVSMNDGKKYVEMRRQSMDVYAEVIDANAGVVLASEGPLRMSDVESGVIPYGWFGNWNGYSRSADSDGLPTVRMIELRLGKK